MVHGERSPRRARAQTALIKNDFSALSIALVVLSSVLSSPGTVHGHFTDATPLPVPEFGATSSPNHVATIYSANLNGPRAMQVLPSGDLLVVEYALERIVRLWDADGDLYSNDTERLVVAEAKGLNHAVIYRGDVVYASSTDTVFRWSGLSDDRIALTGPTTVVQNIPGGGHSTRTLVLDGDTILYVQQGSNGNVDETYERSMVRRFRIDGPLPLEWTAGEVFATGLRNEVGMTLDHLGRLWGVDNGMDNIYDYRADVGADTNNNPIEEMNLFDVNASSPLFYGYPRCWTAGAVPGFGEGTQFGLAAADDEWCRNESNNRSPAFGFQAHSAPITIVFYPPDGPVGRFGFPPDTAGDAFVSFRGSWNRTPPTGYRIVRVRFRNGWPYTYEPFFWWEKSTNSSMTNHHGPDWKRRPTGLAVGRDGELYIADQSLGDIVVIRYLKNVYPLRYCS